ncbi:MAG: hypothetical protein Q4D74_00315 [Comamonadaceae bacterium]|nr:hypothetical protein [Comamonadaceae bacterium]
MSAPAAWHMWVMVCPFAFSPIKTCAFAWLQMGSCFAEGLHGAAMRNQAAANLPNWLADRVVFQGLLSHRWRRRDGLCGASRFDEGKSGKCSGSVRMLSGAWLLYGGRAKHLQFLA